MLTLLCYLLNLTHEICFVVCAALDFFSTPFIESCIFWTNQHIINEMAAILALNWSKEQKWSTYLWAILLSVFGVHPPTRWMLQNCIFFCNQCLHISIALIYTNFILAKFIALQIDILGKCVLFCGKDFVYKIYSNFSIRFSISSIKLGQ